MRRRRRSTLRRAHPRTLLMTFECLVHVADGEVVGEVEDRVAQALVAHRVLESTQSRIVRRATSPRTRSPRTAAAVGIAGCPPPLPSAAVAARAVSAASLPAPASVVGRRAECSAPTPPAAPPRLVRRQLRRRLRTHTLAYSYTLYKYYLLTKYEDILYVRTLKNISRRNQRTFATK